MPIVSDEQTSSRMLSDLPAIYQNNVFLGRFLLPFEAILFGKEHEREGTPESLESMIAGLSAFFDPLSVKEEFLPWLGQWVAVTVRAGVDTIKQRQFIANIMHFYRWRGTKNNLVELLTLLIDGSAEVVEPDLSVFQIGVHSTIGIDTYLGEARAHFFYVKIHLRQADILNSQNRQEYLDHQRTLARTIIEMEKPAHTQYGLEFSSAPAPG